MTLEEYLDPQRFPATTQEYKTTPSGQLLIDAHNYDSLRRFLENCGEPDEEQQKRWAELQEKMKFHAALTAELAAAGQGPASS